MLVQVPVWPQEAPQPPPPLLPQTRGQDTCSPVPRDIAIGAQVGLVYIVSADKPRVVP